MGLSVTISWLFAAYVTLGIFIILGIMYYYDRKETNSCERVRSQVIFHCIKCGHIYADVQGKETSHCEKCGFENTNLKF